MQISASEREGVTILELDGNLTIGAADEAFSAALERQLEGGRSVLVIDMGRVEVVDSTGLGSLVRAHHPCVQAGGGVRLAALGFQVWELFRAAQLVGVIPIFDTLQAAVEGHPES